MRRQAVMPTHDLLPGGAVLSSAMPSHVLRPGWGRRAVRVALQVALGNSRATASRSAGSDVPAGARMPVYFGKSVGAGPPPAKAVEDCELPELSKPGTSIT